MGFLRCFAFSQGLPRLVVGCKPNRKMKQENLKNIFIFRKLPLEEKAVASASHLGHSPVMLKSIYMGAGRAARWIYREGDFLIMLVSGRGRCRARNL